MFFEFRYYRTKEGCREAFVKLMEEEVIPYQVSKGMVVVGSFVGEQEQDLYVWIRRFDSEEQREALYKAVYDTDTWKNEISPKVGGLMDREKIVVYRLSPTSRSVIR